MKNKFKISFLAIIIFIVIIAGNNVYAENTSVANETSNTNSQANTTNTSTSTATNTSSSGASTTSNTTKSSSNTTTNKSTTATKSSNANLKNLGIKPNDFSGFKASVTSYEVTVPLDVESVEVYATAQDSKATVTGTGTKKLNEGENEFPVVVTAEDGTKKTYTIYVTRKETENVEETDGEVSAGKGLAKLEVENATMTPDFQTNIYEYQIQYIGEETSLNLKAEPTDNSYIVEITGNNDLQEGDNIITILVSDKDGDNIATYQITVNKKLVDEEAVAREKAERMKMLIISGAVLALIVLVIIFFVRRKRNQNLAEEYTVPYSGLNDNDEFYGKDESIADINDTENEEDTIEIQEPVMSKEKARETFLDNYNNSDNDYEEEKPKRKRSKGKRFK